MFGLVALGKISLEKYCKMWDLWDIIALFLDPYLGDKTDRKKNWSRNEKLKSTTLLSL